MRSKFTGARKSISDLPPSGSIDWLIDWLVSVNMPSYPRQNPTKKPKNFHTERLRFNVQTRLATGIFRVADDWDLEKASKFDHKMTIPNPILHQHGVDRTVSKFLLHLGHCQYKWSTAICFMVVSFSIWTKISSHWYVPSRELTYPLPASTFESIIFRNFLFGGYFLLGRPIVFFNSTHLAPKIKSNGQGLQRQLRKRMSCGQNRKKNRSFSSLGSKNSKLNFIKLNQMIPSTNWNIKLNLLISSTRWYKYESSRNSRSIALWQTACLLWSPRHSSPLDERLRLWKMKNLSTKCDNVSRFS